MTKEREAYLIAELVSRIGCDRRTALKAVKLGPESVRGKIGVRLARALARIKRVETDARKAARAARAAWLARPTYTVVHGTVSFEMLNRDGGLKRHDAVQGDHIKLYRSVALDLLRSGAIVEGAVRRVGPVSSFGPYTPVVPLLLKTQTNTPVVNTANAADALSNHPNPMIRRTYQLMERHKWTFDQAQVQAAKELDFRGSFLRVADTSPSQMTEFH